MCTFKAQKGLMRETCLPNVGLKVTFKLEFK